MDKIQKALSGLKEKRIKNGNTQYEIAKSVGISRNHYNEIENGKALPSVPVLNKINSTIPIFFFVEDVDNVEQREE